MPDMSGAVLDVNLHGQMVFPLADELRRHIPFIFATAYESQEFPEAYRNVAVVNKGAGADEVAALLLGAPAAE